MKNTSNVTQVLIAARKGEEEAKNQLWSIVYDELRKIAHHQLVSESNKRMLSTTALVHEAYLRLVDEQGIEWQSRAHFFGIASRVMRRVIVDNARKHCAQKRGGGLPPESFDEARFVPEDRLQEVIDLDDALNALDKIHTRWSKVVECKYFGGLKEDEIAEILEVSVRTIERDWAKARAWLYHYMNKPTAEA
ncbi:MAG: sigma-70 family RNA polymerase sigma factor [Rhodothermales bacterium]